MTDQREDQQDRDLASETDPEAQERLRQKKLDQIIQERELAINEEQKTLFTWSAPARPFKRKNREYYTTVGAIVILLSIILMFAREFLLIGVVLAMAFVAYVLSTVEPEPTEHEISTRGVRTGGKFFRWSMLGRFWFKEKYGQQMLLIETFLPFPRQLIMLLGDTKQEDMVKLLKRYLLHETPEKTFLDKASEWMGDKIPLEDTQEKKQ